MQMKLKCITYEYFFYSHGRLYDNHIRDMYSATMFKALNLALKECNELIKYKAIKVTKGGFEIEHGIVGLIKYFDKQYHSNITLDNGDTVNIPLHYLEFYNE